MTPAERLQAAVDLLEALDADLGRVELSADGWLIARADEDTDDDGEYFIYGITVMEPGDPEYDANVAQAIAILAPTLHWQLGALRRALQEADFSPDEPAAFAEVVELADALLNIATRIDHRRSPKETPTT